MCSQENAQLNSNAKTCIHAWTRTVHSVLPIQNNSQTPQWNAFHVHFCLLCSTILFLKFCTYGHYLCYMLGLNKTTWHVLPCVDSNPYLCRSAELVKLLLHIYEGVHVHAHALHFLVLSIFQFFVQFDLSLLDKSRLCVWGVKAHTANLQLMRYWSNETRHGIILQYNEEKELL